MVNLLKYETKENILSKAWKEKIQIDGRQIFFDHDYPTEVMKKRKSYSEIKKTLKSKKIRFQTPLSRIRIHWSEGPKIYNNAEEAARDMRTRGLEVPETRSTDPPLEKCILRASLWQCVGEKPGTNWGTTARRNAGTQGAERGKGYKSL